MKRGVLVKFVMDADSGVLVLPEAHKRPGKAAVEGDGTADAVADLQILPAQEKVDRLPRRARCRPSGEASGFSGPSGQQTVHGCQQARDGHVAEKLPAVQQRVQWSLQGEIASVFCIFVIYPDHPVPFQRHVFTDIYPKTENQVSSCLLFARTYFSQRAGAIGQGTAVFSGLLCYISL